MIGISNGKIYFADRYKEFFINPLFVEKIAEFAIIL